jgi:hypothetical protein
MERSKERSPERDGAEVVRGDRDRLDALSERLETRLGTVIDQLTEVGDVVGRVSAVEDSLRAELQHMAAMLGAEVTAILRNETLDLSRRNDEFGLRLTNLSMSVMQGLDTLRARTDVLAERADGIGAENAAILGSIGEQIDRLQPIVGDQIASRLATFATQMADQLQGLRAEVDVLADRTDRTRVSISDEIQAAIASAAERFASSASPAPDGAAVILDEVRAELASVGERTEAALTSRLDALDREVRVGLDGLVELVSQRLETLDAHRDPDALDRATVAAVSDQIRSLEGSLRAVPSPDEIAGSAADRLEPALANVQRAAVEHGDAIASDLSNVAASVNEIWMRVRELVHEQAEMKQTLDHERAARAEEAARAQERVIEALAERGAALQEGLTTLETRLERVAGALGTNVGSTLADIARRDEAFVRALIELGERLPRKERARFRQRLMPWRRARDGSAADAPTGSEGPDRSSGTFPQPVRTGTEVPTTPPVEAPSEAPTPVPQKKNSLEAASAAASSEEGNATKRTTKKRRSPSAKSKKTKARTTRSEKVGTASDPSDPEPSKTDEPVHNDNA